MGVQSSSLSPNSNGDSDVNLLDPSVEQAEPATDLLTEDTVSVDPPTVDPPTENSSVNNGCGDDNDVNLIDTEAIIHAASRRERALRHRSRRHHRHHRSRSRFCRCKHKETNFLAAMCSMVVVVLVCTSLAEPEWFFVSGGRCRDLRQPISYLGVKTFFYQGKFVDTSTWNPPSTVGEAPQSIYYYGNAQDEVLLDCITEPTVFLMKCIIVSCFVIIIFSLTAFILDLVGPTNRILRAIRTNAVFSILSVCICVTTNGLSFMVTEQLASYYSKVPYRPGSKIDVQFSLSFYIITAAGVISVFGVAANLFRKPIHSGSERSDRRRDRGLTELGDSSSNTRWGGFSSACSQLQFLPPPPPYTE